MIEANKPRAFRASIGVTSRRKLEAISKHKAKKAAALKVQELFKADNNVTMDLDNTIEACSSSASSSSSVLVTGGVVSSSSDLKNDEIKKLSESSLNKIKSINEDEKMLRQELLTIRSMQNSLIFLLKRVTRQELLRNHEANAYPNSLPRTARES